MSTDWVCPGKRSVLVGFAVLLLVSGCLGVREGRTVDGMVNFRSKAELARGRAEVEAVLVKAQVLVVQVTGGHGVSAGKPELSHADASMGSRVFELDNAYFVEGVEHSADFASWSGMVREAWTAAGWKAKIKFGNTVGFTVTTRSGLSVSMEAGDAGSGGENDRSTTISVDYETDPFRVPKSVADAY